MSRQLGNACLNQDASQKKHQELVCMRYDMGSRVYGVEDGDVGGFRELKRLRAGPNGRMVS